MTAQSTTPCGKLRYLYQIRTGHPENPRLTVSITGKGSRTINAVQELLRGRKCLFLQTEFGVFGPKRRASSLPARDRVLVITV